MSDFTTEVRKTSFLPMMSVFILPKYPLGHFYFFSVLKSVSAYSGLSVDESKLSIIIAPFLWSARCILTRHDAF